MPTAPAAEHVDVLIIGAGVAGLVAALDISELAPDLQVAVLDKGAPGGDAGSTPLAQGGMAAAVGPDDSPALHAADTMRAGDGLCDRRAVDVVTTEGPARVADLIRRGAVFDHLPGTDALALAREGGQRVARSVRAADSTGAEIARALRRAARGRVTRLQGVAVALATAGVDGRVSGAWVVLDDVPSSDLGPAHRGGPAFVAAPATLLATGGCGGLYAATTNPDSATADGVALAYRAGAQISDMEFVQFHPTGLRPRNADGHQRFLLTEALRGAGAHLVNAAGDRFMLDRHPDAELAPRYVVTRAILDQPGGAWMDATRIPRQQLRDEFPTVLKGARRAGYDLGGDRVPVEPCEHYMIGGVATDLLGRTSVPGLWAAGEVACPGVHGANRMAGNSLLQASVFAHRAAGDIVAAVRAATPGGPPAAPTTFPGRPRPPVAPHVDPSPDPHVGPPVHRSNRDMAVTDGPPAGEESLHPVSVANLRRELRDIMSAGAGAVRTAEGLRAAARGIAALRSLIGPGPFADRDLTEADSALLVAGLIVDSALLRAESRGTHWREDHPEHDPFWEGCRIRVASPPATDAGSSGPAPADQIAADHRSTRIGPAADPPGGDPTPPSDGPAAAASGSRVLRGSA